MLKQVGIVIIGRNEGVRLRDCLMSCCHNDGCIIVYVDSGSTDNSVNVASEFNIDILELDSSKPFSAARARNEGLKFIQNKNKETEYIQFIDGDCVLNSSWIKSSVEYLNNNSRTSIVTGLLTEKNPETSIYNMLCSIEWDTNIGKLTGCGGIFMARIRDLVMVEGFREDLIAGEEPELCLRLRLKDKNIIRIDRKMAVHDANMTLFWQWWAREIRSGHAYFECFWIYLDSKTGYRRKEVFSIIFWAVALPVSVIFLYYYTHYSLFLLALYPYKIIRLSWHYYINNSVKKKIAVLYGASNVLSKFPKALGVMKYILHRITSKSTPLIEHK